MTALVIFIYCLIICGNLAWGYTYGMRKIIIWLVIIVVVAGLAWYFFPKPHISNTNEGEQGTPTTTPTSTEPEVQSNATSSVLGKSVEGRNITAYYFGTGP